MFDNFFFDYIYYRLHQANRNKGIYQGVPAIMIISVIQVMFLSGVIGILIRATYVRSMTAPSLAQASRLCYTTN